MKLFSERITSQHNLIVQILEKFDTQLSQQTLKAMNENLDVYALKKIVDDCELVLIYTIRCHLEYITERPKSTSDDEELNYKKLEMDLSEIRANICLLKALICLGTCRSGIKIYTRECIKSANDHLHIYEKIKETIS